MNEKTPKPTNEQNPAIFTEEELANMHRVAAADAEVMRRERGKKMVEVDGVIMDPKEAAGLLDPADFDSRVHNK